MRDDDKHSLVELLKIEEEHLYLFLEGAPSLRHQQCWASLVGRVAVIRAQARAGCGRETLRMAATAYAADYRSTLRTLTRDG